MKFSLVNCIRTQPSPKQRGICCYCGEPTTSRCGSKHVWHWAHLPNKHCDPWWENETNWHRQWKGYFPEDNQEVVHFDAATGEKHVADVKTNDGLVIEFQNSPMDSVELRSRENFYGDVIWIVNGAKFMNDFHILGALPDPDAEFAQDIVFNPQRVDWPRGGFWRLSENPDHRVGSGDLVLMHRMSGISDQIESHYIGHHMFDWRHPRSVWFESKKPVYFDFGSEEVLLKIAIYRTYGDRALRCVQYVSKQFIIESNGGVYATSANAL